MAKRKLPIRVSHKLPIKISHTLPKGEIFSTELRTKENLEFLINSNFCSINNYLILKGKGLAELNLDSFIEYLIYSEPSTFVEAII